MVDALSGLDHQVVTQPHQAAQRANLLIGTERSVKQTETVELLNPLAIEHVGLGATGHVLDMPGVNHPDLKAALLKDFIKGDPIDTGRFQGDRLNSASLEPIGQLVKIRSKRFEASHRLWITIRGHGHHMLFGSYVDSCRVGMDQRQTLQRDTLLGLILVL